MLPIIVIFSLINIVLGEEPSKYPESTADISSINDLEYKSPVTLDPRIRKALLNVLNRLEEQESAKSTEEDSKSFDFEIDPQNTDFEIKRPQDDVKWEYKANNSFEEYNFQESRGKEAKATQTMQAEILPTPNAILASQTVSTRASLPNQNQLTTKFDTDSDSEPGALFFQIPGADAVIPNEKAETLRLQETKNILPNSIIYKNLIDQSSKPKDDDKNATKVNEKDVEVFQAPLLTAFTLVHDENGQPRKVIPLNNAEINSLLTNQLDSSPEVRTARQQNDQNTNLFELQFRQQYQELQERKRQLELEKEKYAVEQERARQLQLALEQKRREQDYQRFLLQNEIPRSAFLLQKSVEPQTSLIQVSPFVDQFTNRNPRQNIGLQNPEIVDRQLQNLFQRSGIKGQHEDLNIVTKILALNHQVDERPELKFNNFDTNRFNLNDINLGSNKRVVRRINRNYPYRLFN